jgi:hypothetical protein
VNCFIIFYREETMRREWEGIRGIKGSLTTSFSCQLSVSYRKF